MDSFLYVNVTILSRFSQIYFVLRTLLCSLAMNTCLLRLLSPLEWLCSPSPACSCHLLLILNVALIFWNKEAGRGILNIFCWQHSLQVYGPRQKHSPLFFITGTPVSEHNSALSCLFCLLTFHVSVSGLKADGQICTHKSDGAKKKKSVKAALSFVPLFSLIVVLLYKPASAYLTVNIFQKLDLF